MMIFQGIMGIVFFLALFGAFFWVIVSAKPWARVIVVLIALAIVFYTGHEWGRSLAAREALEQSQIERRDLGKQHRETLTLLAGRTGNAELAKWMEEARDESMDIDTLVFLMQEKIRSEDE